LCDKEFEWKGAVVGREEQSFNQPNCQPIYHAINPSIKQAINPSIKQAINQSINLKQSIKSISQSINQSINQTDQSSVVVSC
jgi:hypothetical protein